MAAESIIHNKMLDGSTHPRIMICLGEEKTQQAIIGN